MTSTIPTISIGPRILTNAEEYGSVEQKDIDRFKEIYARWPEKYRQLMEAGNLTFHILGDDSLVAHPDFANRSYGIRAADIEKVATDAEYGKNYIKRVPYTALLAVLGEGPEDIAWQKALQEVEKIQKRQLNGIERNRLGAFSVLAIALQAIQSSKGDEEKAKNTAPLCVKVFQQYREFADKKYEELRKQIIAERADKYKASDTAFAINNEPGILTQPQQLYFEKLNELVKLLGITPKEFDGSFKASLAAQIWVNAVDGGCKFMESGGDDVSVAATDTFNAYKKQKDFCSIVDKLDKRYLPIASGHTKKKNYEIPQTLPSCIQEVLKGTIAVVQPHLPFDSALDKHAWQVTDINEAISNFHSYYESNGKSDSTNLLQLYANAGKNLSDLKSTKQPIAEIWNYKLLLPSETDYFESSIYNAAVAIAEKQLTAEIIDKEKFAQIKGKLEEISTLWPQVIMTAEQYQQYEATQTLRAQQEQLRQTAAERQDAERLAKEKAEREGQAARPGAYIITSAAYGRITKFRDIHPRTLPEERALIQNMQALQSQLHPFSQPENMDTKIPQHKAVGDALFKDVILTQLEYVFRPNGNGAPPACDPAHKEETREAVRAIYAVNEQTPNLVPEDLGDNKALRAELHQSRLATNERLKNLLEQSPAIVIAAMGTQEQTQQLREWQQIILAENSNHVEAKQAARRDMRNMAYTLLNEVGATVKVPPLDIAAVTADGRLLVTEAAYLPPPNDLILTISPLELDTNTLAKKLLAAAVNLAERMHRARIMKDQSAIKNLQPTQLVVDRLFDNHHQEQETLFQRIRDAFAAGKPMEMALSDATSPIPPSSSIPINGDVLSWDAIRHDVDTAIQRILPLDTQNPYRMFRCHMSTEPGHPLKLEFSRWVGNGSNRHSEKRPLITVDINRADVDEALDIKKRVQAYVLNTPPIASYRRLINNTYEFSETSVLPNAMPIIDPQRPESDNRAGRLESRHGLWNLRLVYDNETVAPGEPERTIAHIPLGIEQAGSREEANARRLLALDYLQDLHTQNQQFIANGQQDRIRLVTGRDVNMWLEQQIGTLRQMSETARQVPADDEVLNQRMHAFAVTLHQPIPPDTTPQDWLAQQTTRIGNRWEQARSIDLRDYNIQRELTVDFPPAAAGQSPRTMLILNDPVYVGGDVPYWHSLLRIKRDGQLIGSKIINTHIKASGPDNEPGSDPESIVNRVNAAAHFVQNALQAYGRAYPDADWHVTGTPPKLEQYNQVHQLGNTPNIDETRLDTLFEALPYKGLLKVNAIISENDLQPDAENTVRFTLTVNREDGSAFNERLTGLRDPVPIVREFKMQAGATPEITRRSINDFAKHLQNSFSDRMEDSFSPFHDPTYDAQSQPRTEREPMEQRHPQLNATERLVTLLRYGPTVREIPPAPVPHGENAPLILNPVGKYSPPTMVIKFNDILDSALRTDIAQQAQIEQLPETRNRNHGGNNGNWQPGDPMHRRSPTDEQLEAIRGFRKYAQRSDNSLDRQI